MKPLTSVLSKSLCTSLKRELNIEFVEDANRYTNEALLKVRGFGKMALIKLRESQPSHYEPARTLTAIYLPSDIQYGEECILNLGRVQLDATVVGINFSKMDFTYDLKIKIMRNDSGFSYATIRDVESYLVKKVFK